MTGDLTDLESVWQGYRNARDAGSNPFRAAAKVASEVDRLGLAFAAGYSAALETLVPGVALPCALCVTEVDGAHPRAIQTALTAAEGGSGYTLNGSKSFVTFGDRARTLVIAARVGQQPDGRPELAVVRIPSDREGVLVQELPPIPFVPEVPHARVEFQNVVVDASERLSGDGYLRYVKPFRTVEDIHVYGSALAYLLGLAKRTKAPSDLLTELRAAIATLDGLREGPPLDPNIHVALHAVIQDAARLLSTDSFSSVWDAAPEEERLRWERDRKLLQVANSAREARFQKAATQLGLC